MTFIAAAIEVLRRADGPLTIEDLTRRALVQGLLTTKGKTPAATMTAQLYVAARDDPNCPVERIFGPGEARARRGSVRWRLRASM